MRKIAITAFAIGFTGIVSNALAAPVTDSRLVVPTQEQLDGLKSIYTSYLIAKPICGLTEFGKYSLRQFKVMGDEIENHAKSQGIDTDSIWDAAANDSFVSLNEKMVATASAAPLGMADQNKFNTNCRALMAVLNAGHRWYMTNYGGVKKGF